MELMRGLPRRPRWPYPVVTIGVFDGVHRGHQAILRKTIEIARANHGTSLAIILDPHPEKILSPDHAPPVLYPLSYRLKFMEALGLDGCLIQPFTPRFARMKAEAFISSLVTRLGIQELVVGYDYHFGHRNRGDVLLLEDWSHSLGYRLHCVRPVTYRGMVPSSTTIRQLISQGRLAEAAHLLGRPVSMVGTVVRGSGRGRRLGVPTANLDHDHEVLLPRGVYVVQARWDHHARRGAANIGYRPTFGLRRHLTVEVHLLRCHETLYGKTLEVQFLRRLRPERRFASSEALKAQMTHDLLALHRSLDVL